MRYVMEVLWFLLGPKPRWSDGSKYDEVSVDYSPGWRH
jgi:hypothetical protein